VSAPIASVYGCYVLSRRISMQESMEFFQVRWIENPATPLALKRLMPHLSTEPSVREAFLDISRQAGLLNHPNLTQVLDQGQAAPADSSRDSKTPAPEASLFMVREWVHGRNLEKIIERADKRGQRISPELCVYIFFCAATALDHALKEPDQDGKPLGLIHGHLCLENLLVSHSGQVKVSDLGLAVSLNGRKPQERDDVRALGAMLWEMLGNRKLPRRGEAPPLSSLNPEVPQVLDIICSAALAWEPENALSDVGQLRKALEEAGGAKDRQEELAGLMDQLFGPELAKEREGLAQELEMAESIRDGRAKVRTCGGILSEDELAMLVTPEPPLPLWRRVLKPIAWAAGLAALVLAVYFFWPPGQPVSPPLPSQAQAAAEAIKQGGFERAFVLLEQARSEHPELAKELDRLKAQAFLGRASAQIEESPEAAYEDLEDAAELAPGWAQVYFQTGRVLTKQKRWEEALAAYRRALALDSKLDAAWFNAGYILMQQDRCEEAMADFAKVVELDSPHTADAHLNRAVCWVRMGERAKALKELKLALVRNPNHKLAQSYLAKVRGQTKTQ
jgi:tetratricopeptide (TPR) repeat protein